MVELYPGYEDEVRETRDREDSNIFEDIANNIRYLPCYQDPLFISSIERDERLERSKYENGC